MRTGVSFLFAALLFLSGPGPAQAHAQAPSQSHTQAHKLCDRLDYLLNDTGPKFEKIARGAQVASLETSGLVVYDAQEDLGAGYGCTLTVTSDIVRLECYQQQRPKMLTGSVKACLNKYPGWNLLEDYELGSLAGQLYVGPNITAVGTVRSGTLAGPINTLSITKHF